MPKHFRRVAAAAALVPLALGAGISPAHATSIYVQAERVVDGRVVHAYCVHPYDRTLNFDVAVTLEGSSGSDLNDVEKVHVVASDTATVKRIALAYYTDDPLVDDRAGAAPRPILFTADPAPAYSSARSGASVSNGEATFDKTMVNVHVVQVTVLWRMADGDPEDLKCFFQLPGEDAPDARQAADEEGSVVFGGDESGAAEAPRREPGAAA